MSCSTTNHSHFIISRHKAVNYWAALLIPDAFGIPKSAKKHSYCHRARPSMSSAKKRAVLADQLIGQRLVQWHHAVLTGALPHTIHQFSTHNQSHTLNASESKTEKFSGGLWTFIRFFLLFCCVAVAAITFCSFIVRHPYDVQDLFVLLGFCVLYNVISCVLLRGVVALTVLQYSVSLYSVRRRSLCKIVCKRT